MTSEAHKRKTKAERAAEKAAAKARARAVFLRRLAEEPKPDLRIGVSAEMIARDAAGELDVPRVAKIGKTWLAFGSDLALFRLHSQAGDAQ